MRRFYLFSMILMAVAVLSACASKSLPEHQSEPELSPQEKKTATVQTSPTSPTSLPADRPTDPRLNPQATPQNPSQWEEYSEEDVTSSTALDEAMIIIAKALKRGRILSIQTGKPVCLIMKKDPQGIGHIGIFQMTSAAGQKPVVPGQLLEEYTLAAAVTWEEPVRYFWYDKDGNIDFFEPDQVLRVFDNPPRGDIVLHLRNPNIPRRGVMDINKNRTQMEFHQYLTNP